MEMKLQGEGSNSGIQSRATKLGEVPASKSSKWDLRGCQADFDLLNSPIAPSAARRCGLPPPWEKSRICWQLLATRIN